MRLEVREEEVRIQDLFDEQRPLFATEVTRTYEWRVEQLDRMAGMISDHKEEFRKAMAIRVMTVAMQTLAGQNRTGPSHWRPGRYDRPPDDGRMPPHSDMKESAMSDSPMS